MCLVGGMRLLAGCRSGRLHEGRLHAMRRLERMHALTVTCLFPPHWPSRSERLDGREAKTGGMAAEAACERARRALQARSRVHQCMRSSRLCVCKHPSARLLPDPTAPGPNEAHSKRMGHLRT